ncbi:hypothetical protein MA16_Dca014344 [Dendrobium catenatum]|uniref:Uncharacterized protein n=1 Tax=Dendrobium catenatum TaxID=906689 RepID=A0A2I0WWD7_9ASPA|nr:hypothetical protein MA16_Dca014344 [Dendrobium catenatum]
MGEKFKQIRTKLSGVPKFLPCPILRKKTILMSTNTENNESATPKILKGVLSISAVVDSEVQKDLSPVNEKRESQFQDEEIPHNI